MAAKTSERLSPGPGPKRVRWFGSSTAGLPEPAAASNLAGAYVTCVDYSPEQYQFQEVTDIAEFLSRHRPEWSAVRWINIDDVSDPDVIRAFAEKYELHPLAIHSTLEGGQRPKVEDYPGSEEHPGRLFILARMLRVEQGYLYDEQISFFLGRRTLLTFQQDKGDVFNPIRERLKHKDSRLRHSDVSALLHALLEAIVDQLFPILEDCSDQLELLEQATLKNPRTVVLSRLHRLRRELLLLRRAAWPMREIVNQLQREPRVSLAEASQVYYRDIYNNLTQIIDLLETYREFAASIADTYMSGMANRMNEIVKTLTIISTIFVPLTFLAGVYGMNMPIPENHSPWTYPVFWTFALSVAAAMLLWFRRRGWI